MQSLPSHLLTQIISASCIEPDYKARQRRLTKYLRINSAFYLATLPLLYADPLVSSVDTFLYGADRQGTFPSTAFTCGPVTHLVEEESSVGDTRTYETVTRCGDNQACLLAQAGQYKLSGLLHTRHATIHLPNIYAAYHDADFGISDRLKRHMEAELKEVLVGQVDRARSILANLANAPHRPGIFPSLTTVSVGELAYNLAPWPLPLPGVEAESDWADEIVPDFAPGLLAIASPRVWCQSLPSARYLAYDPSRCWTTSTKQQAREKNGDFVLVNHIHLLDDFHILPTGTTYVYVHPDWRALGLRDGDWLFTSRGTLDSVSVETLCDWLVRQLARTKRFFDEMGVRVCGKSTAIPRVIIGGVLRPGVGPPEYIPKLLARIAEEVQSKVCLALDIPAGQLDDVMRVELRLPRDISPCAACGMRC